MGTSVSHHSLNHEEAHDAPLIHSQAQHEPSQQQQPPHEQHQQQQQPSQQPNQEQSFPRLSQAQIRNLIRSGMKPDLCLMPYQMPRMDNGDELSPLPSKPRPTIRIKNDINLHKTSLSFIRYDNSSLYTLSFKFDCMCETDVTVYYCAKEHVDGKNTSMRFSASPHHISTARYGAGKSHHYIQTLEEGLDTSVLSATQMKHHSGQRYWPVIIHLQATQLVDLPLEEKKSISHSTSIEQLHAQQTDIHARIQTTFVTMARTGAEGALQLKVVKQKIKVAGQSYELQEIYGIETKTDETPASPASPEVDTSSAEAQECVVCMTEPRDTTIFPCRHMCLCSTCAEIVRVQTNRCPICRCVVQSLFKMPTLVSSHSVENLSSQHQQRASITPSTPVIPEEHVVNVNQ